MFNPARLVLARHRRKLTKKELAELARVSDKTIIRYESGGTEPTPENLASIARALEFPESFFTGSEVDEIQAGAVSFRSLKALLVRDRDSALAASAFAFMLNDWLCDRFALPQTDILSFKGDVDPESAARLLRQKWGLGEARISNVLHLLESKGVRIFSLVEDTRALDAFSMWRIDTPFVFLNTKMTSERSRFDAAHELGHLVLHRHGGPQGGRVTEDEANAFASAFLMPKAQVVAKLPRIKFLSEIVQAKKHWGVSVAALNHRLHKLGVTTDWQYRTFCIQINQQFGQSEPYALARERSLLWEKVFSALRTERVTKNKIADSLGLPVAEIETLVFQLTNMLSIEGQGTGTGIPRARLRVVN
jgi:Zn-dependent peptidase ImmA (M78 family)/transcriptional regulator with XRE-family HTH domain